MAILTIELPEEVTVALAARHVPNRLVHQFVVQAVKVWLQSDNLMFPQTAEEVASALGESNLLWVEPAPDEPRSEHFSLAEHLQHGLTDVLLGRTTRVHSEEGLKSHLDCIFEQA